MADNTYITVPGRGLNTKSAIKYRIDYLDKNNFKTEEIQATSLNHIDIQNNIESFIGSVEIPVGIIGPLRLNTGSDFEDVYTVGATLEGALIASMNRGAKVISLSGGFEANFVHQKMIRTPLFLFNSEEDAMKFEKWIEQSFLKIKEKVENYSNHACLIELATDRIKKDVHVDFVYTTGDAAGQNMTTTCTWHGILWLTSEYELQNKNAIVDYVLEGNGASDKKVSQFLINHGRGVKIIVSSILKEEIIQSVLRTSSEKLLLFYQPSKKITSKRGMVGYSINASNAIAAIFAATGQDLASIHESSVADLSLKKHPKGLFIELTLHSLVIGTLGGGTQLPKQKEALELMGCYGENKIKRFASIIAGFTLGLELSTYAAIVSGEFAKAHEKLGRNKPHDWLQWNEITPSFLEAIISPFIPEKINHITIKKGEVDVGILMNLSQRVNRKLTGFIPINVSTKNDAISLLIKSKPTTEETIKGLHLMAASVDPSLSDLITIHKEKLEYFNNHQKELDLPQFLSENNFRNIPAFYGTYKNESREIYFLIQEHLKEEEIELIDSENSPHKWFSERIILAISAIHKAHEIFKKRNNDGIIEFDLLQSIALYKKTIGICKKMEKSSKYSILDEYLNDLVKSKTIFKVQKTVIHNDFNPRNVILRKNGEICIYDWELAVKNFPHRDIVEFLSFTLNQNFSKEELFSYLKYHYSISQKNNEIGWEEWKEIYVYSLKEFLITRISFYHTSEVIMKLKFVNHVFENCIQMIKFIENE